MTEPPSKRPEAMTERELQVHMCNTLIQIRGVLKTIEGLLHEG